MKRSGYDVTEFQEQNVVFSGALSPAEKCVNLMHVSDSVVLVDITLALGRGRILGMRVFLRDSFLSSAISSDSRHVSPRICSSIRRRASRGVCGPVMVAAR